MLTLLLYVLIVGLVATLLFLLASAVFGRSEELGPLPEGTTATVLPGEGITGADVRALRFQQVVRGYKVGEVDWALARLAARIDELQTQLAQARAEQAANGSAQAGAVPPTPAAGNIPEDHHIPKDQSSGPTGSSSGTTAPGGTVAPTDPSDGRGVSDPGMWPGQSNASGAAYPGVWPGQPSAAAGTVPERPTAPAGPWPGDSGSSTVPAPVRPQGWPHPQAGAISREQR